VKPAAPRLCEYDNPGFDVRGAELFSALCKRDGVCPRFARLNRHNHLSEVLAFNTPDEYLGREILEGIRILQSLLSPRRLRVDAVLAAALRHASGRA
jgi:hypothetical protein